jgi:hypothetical protein
MANQDWLRTEALPLAAVNLGHSPAYYSSSINPSTTKLTRIFSSIFLHYDFLEVYL